MLGRATCLLTALVVACRHPERFQTRQPVIAVELVSDEADAAMAILDDRARGVRVADAAWQRLFDSDGYQDLKRRELGMRREFSDSAFRAFLLSDTLLARRQALRVALDDYRHLDVDASARRAAAYLPAPTTIRSRLYLEIKPRTNSFVYPVPSGRAIFLYVDPARPRDRVEDDIVTHELHHIGIAQSCPQDSTAPPSPIGAARSYAGALAEGLAMLAAAGDPGVDPHVASAPSVRERWHRDLARWPDDLRRVERFLLDIGEGRLANHDSIAAAAAPFWGDAQGAWYTVGCAVATTIERAAGREALRGVVCDAGRMLRLYNELVQHRPELAGLPRWSDRLLALLRT